MPMYLENKLRGKKVAILGYGKEGKASEKILKHFFPDVKYSILDLAADPDYLKKAKQFDIAIKTPGIPKQQVPIPYITNANLFFGNDRHFKIGVTGSKGKSTTSSLIHAVLLAGDVKSRLVGNIGQPMVLELLRKRPADTVYVIELSSYQIDDLDFSPDISVILNLFPDHLPYHGSRTKYYAAKKRLLAHSTGQNYFVYNPAYTELTTLARRTKAIDRPFAARLPRGLGKTHLLGRHNRDNMRAVLTVADIMDIPQKAVIKALRHFKPLPHRLQTVGVFKGIRFVDDAISTTPESTIAALTSLPNVKTMFLGGLDRGYAFDQLARVMQRRRVSTVVLFPDTGARIKKSLQKAYGRQFSQLHILETRRMKDAVAFAYAHTPKRATCVLSCASPSFVLWKDYKAKGLAFARSVHLLAKT